MSSAAPVKDVSLNPNSTTSYADPNGTLPSLFRPTRAVYPPLPGQSDPDELIRDIPFTEKTFSDFQSVPFAQAPKRDVPSVIIAHLSSPQTSSPAGEPDWDLLMNHFRETRCLDGPGNCQDLYIFLTRLVIPNAIIENRRLLHELYMEKRTLSPNVRFRYDYWYTHQDTYVPLSAENLVLVPSRPNRPVLRSVPTPSGQNFLQWLRLPLNTPADKLPCPSQLVHRPCDLDAYLSEDEALVRQVRPEALLRRTCKVLSLFWWISAQNAWLRVYESAGWVGIEQACFHEAKRF